MRYVIKRSVRSVFFLPPKLIHTFVSEKTVLHNIMVYPNLKDIKQLNPYGPIWAHLFLGLRNSVVNSLVLVLRASRILQKLAVLFSYNPVISDLQCTLRINELSRGSVLCYKNHYFY